MKEYWLKEIDRSHDKFIEISSNHGDRVVFKREEMFEILVGELEEVLAPIGNHELVNYYVKQGYVINDVVGKGENTFLKMVCRRKAIRIQNEEKNKQSEKINKHNMPSCDTI